MRGGLLALVLVAGAAPAAADPLALLDDCIHRLDPSLDVGYARITSRCPQLAPALAASPFAPWLPADWSKSENALSVGGLAELRTLISRRTVPATVRAPQVAHLQNVLAQLQHQEAAQRSWWTRCKDWLRRILTPQPGAEDSGWLRRLLTSLDLSESLQSLIVWGAVLVVVLLAAVIVINELKVAGLLRVLRRRRASAAAPPAPARLAAGLQELEHANAREQPQLLLEMIVRQLVAQERLPPARALTLHELERSARLTDAAERTRLAQLTTACERARFDAEPPPAPLLAVALAGGRELLAALSAGAATPAGAG
jgi:hypothetical protein